MHILSQDQPLIVMNYQFASSVPAVDNSGSAEIVFPQLSTPPFTPCTPQAHYQQIVNINLAKIKCQVTYMRRLNEKVMEIGAGDEQISLSIDSLSLSLIHI